MRVLAFMRAVQSLFAAIMLVAPALTVVSADPADARGCRRCNFAGLCRETRVDCLPSEARCRPTGGIVLFNSMPPNEPAYWTLFAQARGRRKFGQLRGRLEAFADAVAPLPAVPGFPGRCETKAESHYPVCLAETATFSGLVANDRLMGVATYADGSTCEFRTTLLFGLGAPNANTFVCRNESGQVLSEGALRVRGLRLRGCKDAGGGRPIVAADAR